jgi:hypothetical protein
MKKILGMLGAIGLVATSSATVVSCGDPATDTTTYELLSGQAEAMKNALGELSHKDFKGVDKDNQYQQFFNMLPNSADDGVHVDSLDKMFYTPMTALWASTENATDINDELLNWSHDALTLVALQHQVNEEGVKTGEDKLLKTFSSDDKTSTLKDLYTGALADNGITEDGHETLAIKVAANYGGVDLGKDFFLTFTFATKA